MKLSEGGEQSIVLHEIDDQSSLSEKAGSSHEEAVQHIDAHRDLFEHYAHGAINVLPAPEGMNTFAFDLKTNSIYVNSCFYKELGFSEEKTTFATLHEIEHLLEKVQMLGEKGGERGFTRYIDQIQKSKAFGLMDNCVADIRENRTVVARTHAEFGQIERKCYTEDLFPSTDFTSQPLHIQLPYAILRESRVPGEMCAVAPEVREMIDELGAVRSKEGVGLMDVMTHPDTPMSTRLALQNKYIWPKVQELLKKDLENQDQSKQDKAEEGNEEGHGESDEGQDESLPNEGKKPGEPSQTSSGDKNKGKPKKTEGDTGKPDPNEIFKDAYRDAEKHVPNAVPIDEIKKAFEEWKEAEKDNPLLRADKEYADKLGVKPEELEQYRRIVASLEQIKNPETNESVIAELHSLISKIISERRKPATAPQYPVEDGEFINDPAMLVSEVKAGNLTPKVWETLETVEQRGQKFGEVDITLVCDRSGSMEQGTKLAEQRKAAVLFMEVLKEFADQAEEERMNLIKPLEIRSEIYTFQHDTADGTPVKKMSKELTEKERIATAAILSSAPGASTPDFVPLESVALGLDKETKHKIALGELKKIIIVFTDGGSDNSSRVQEVLGKLRKDGVVVVGVGITQDGAPALTTYAPDARLAETAAQLPLVLGELLKEHLSNV